MKRRVLITGGAGFIGCNLARHLMEYGWQVHALDDLSLGRAANLPRGAALLTGDAAGEAAWRDAPPVGALVHLAGASSAPMFAGDLCGCFQNNIQGFLRVLEFARGCGAARVVYASTSSVYGNAPPPLREEGPLDIPNFYAVSKFCMEQIARMYHLHYGLEAVGMRFMSVYGPREDHKGRFANLVSQFIWDVEAGRSPVVYGDGSQTRDFTSVWDVARAIRLVLEHPESLGSSVFNVGTGRATPVNELIAALSEAMGVPVRAEYVPNPVGRGYVREQAAGLERIERVLGFRPQVSLRDGIAEILALRAGAQQS